MIRLGLAAGVAVVGSAAVVAAADVAPTSWLTLAQPIATQVPIFSLGLLGIIWWVAKRLLDIMGPTMKDRFVDIVTGPGSKKLEDRHKLVLSKIEELGENLGEHQKEMSEKVGFIGGEVRGLKREVDGIVARLNAGMLVGK